MGKKSSKTKTEVQLPQWAQSLAQGAGNQILNTVSGNQGNLDAIAGGIRGHLGQLGSMAFGQQPGLASAQGYASDVLGGKYLNSNPYIDQMASEAGEAAGNAVNSAFSSAGRTGGGNNVQRLAQGVATANNQLRYGNYAQERQNQTAAAGLLPSLTAAQYAGITPYLAAAQSAAGIPYAGIGNLGQIGGLYGGSGTTSGTQPGGWGTALLSAGVSALPFIPGISDARAKDNIKLVGKLENGLGLYEWDYKADIGIEGRWRGVMAQEVAKALPWMLGPEVNGYMTVKYTPERVG